MARYVEGEQRRGRRVRAVIVQKDGPILTPAQADLARSFTPQHAKLTKRFCMSLPSGAFLASNVFGGPGVTPSFAEQVEDSADARSAPAALARTDHSLAGTPRLSAHTAAGLRTALFYTHAYDRVVAPGFADFDAAIKSDPTDLRRAFARIDQEWHQHTTALFPQAT